MVLHVCEARQNDQGRCEKILKEQNLRPSFCTAGRLERTNAHGSELQAAQLPSCSPMAKWSHSLREPCYTPLKPQFCTFDGISGMPGPLDRNAISVLTIYDSLYRAFESHGTSFGLGLGKPRWEEITKRGVCTARTCLMEITLLISLSCPSLLTNPAASSI